MSIIYNQTGSFQSTTDWFKDVKQVHRIFYILEILEFIKNVLYKRIVLLFVCYIFVIGNYLGYGNIFYNKSKNPELEGHHKYF